MTTTLIDTTSGREPRAAGTLIADIVHRAHENGVDAVRDETGAAGFTNAALEAIMTYCAEKRCEGDGVACPGCRQFTEREGIRSFDDFCGRYATIRCETTGLMITGSGEGDFTAPSLEALAKSWAGEEYWFWARRVLRKVRYGVRRTDELFDPAFELQEAPAVILTEPQIAENIGMVARAMANFGLDDLRITNPRDGWPSEKARAVASGASAIVDGAGLHDDLQSAIGDLHWTVATTARQRDMRKPVMTPEEAAAELRKRIGEGQRCGIVFGRERNGLTSEEIADCHAIVMIPVNAKFASLNLAQAVLLLGYAWLRSGDEGTLGRVTVHDRRISSGLHLGHDVPAKRDEIQRFFEHLEGELEIRGFFTPPERKHVTVRNLRSMFLRMGATAQEVRTLRGIVATLVRCVRRN